MTEIFDVQTFVSNSAIINQYVSNIQISLPLQNFLNFRGWFRVGSTFIIRKNISSWKKIFLPFFRKGCELQTHNLFRIYGIHQIYGIQGPDQVACYKNILRGIFFLYEIQFPCKSKIYVQWTEFNTSWFKKKILEEKWLQNSFTILPFSISILSPLFLLFLVFCREFEKIELRGQKCEIVTKQLQ